MMRKNIITSEDATSYLCQKEEPQSFLISFPKEGNKKEELGLKVVSHQIFSPGMESVSILEL
jgi:hypothetical protein